MTVCGRYVQEKDDSEQVDEIDETADLNMMCCDITEVYPVSYAQLFTYMYHIPTVEIWPKQNFTRY